MYTHHFYFRGYIIITTELKGQETTGGYATTSKWQRRHSNSGLLIPSRKAREFWEETQKPSLYI